MWQDLCAKEEYLDYLCVQLTPHFLIVYSTIWYLTKSNLYAHCSYYLLCKL